MGFFGHAESWVLVSFILFIALLVYLKVPGMIARSLDERSAKIAKELDEARKLREEAAKLLEEFKQKQVSAEAVTAAKAAGDQLVPNKALWAAQFLPRRDNCRTLFCFRQILQRQ